jgi:endonuclease/exonuclease/phosphatase family metal-dependent hydrolase
MPLLAGLGYRSWVSTAPGVPDGPSVVLLAAERAGDVQVRVGTGMRMRHLEATGGVLGERRLYAVHTKAPTGRARTAWWHAELELIGRWCRGPVAPIVAGDLNATLDHAPLRAALGGCRSAASGTGRGLVGTYPSSLPRWLGIQIDHVLVPADAVTSRFSVHDITGTDHRAVLAAVRLPA